MGPLVRVHDWDGNYLTEAYIEGMEYVRGEYGWFSSLILLTLDGRRLQGYKHVLTPPVPLIEWDWKDGNDAAGD